MVTESYQNGSRYTGEKLNGLRQGKGRMDFAEGGFYEGKWKENTMNGKGIFTHYFKVSFIMITDKKHMKVNLKMVNFITLVICGIRYL